MAEKKVVRGVVVEEVAAQFRVFQVVPGTTWSYDSRQRRLSCMGEFIAQGIRTIGEAVLYALAYSQCGWDLVRRARIEEKEKEKTGITGPILRLTGGAEEGS